MVWMADYYLVDNEGNIRTTKHLVGHIQTVFNEIRSKEEIVYPWKVTTSLNESELVIDENTTQQDWRDYNEACSRLL